MNIDRPIKDLSSQLISVDKKSSIRNAIDLMIKQGIRNIGISGDKEVAVKPTIIITTIEKLNYFAL